MTKPPSPKSLKDQNKWQLWLAIAGNAAAAYAASQWTDVATTGLHGLFDGALHLLPVGLAVLLTSVANALVGPDAKYRLVFLRMHNALPGHRAFTEYGPRDPRIDMSEVKRQLGNKLPRDPDEQNKAWYRLYKQVEKAPPVESVHREFLLLRDYTALSLVFLVALGALAGFAVRPATVLAGYLGFLVLQFVLVRLAAANCGKRFVTTVLAEQSVATPQRKRASRP
ncbi:MULTISPECIES: hypothetical protein [Bradyrhizobium]|uniref:hypothetical protein n=1 Tax=Bradyrhizobium TaxID=374 RepID=UPI00195854B6|nr:hypothetical protein [Bradyrhizobium canariense]MBM7486112.1 hypothetical protein [Bradyrhizobium canariense]